MFSYILTMEEGDPGDSTIDTDSSDLSEAESETEHGEHFSDSSESSDEDIDSGDGNDEQEVDEEDILISTITSRQEITQTKPQPIKSDELFTDLTFHPESNIIAMSCLSGNIEVYLYSVDGNSLKGTIEAHLKTCRVVEFSPDGKTLYSVGRDKNIVFSDLERMDMKMFVDSAHHVAMSALHVADENVLATGDDEGVVKIWDTRFTQTPAFKAHDAHEYISCITSKDKFKIACTSGDGTIVSYDIRSSKKLQESAPFDTDLTSCTSTHNETMLVCGTMAGKFLFYKWNDFSDIAGTFKPVNMKKCPINSVLQISDNIIVAGMEDGVIRAYHFFPHKEIGIVGQHNLNIEGLDISPEGNMIASLSYDHIVKFWDISYLEGFEVTEVEKNNTKCGTNLPSSEFDDRKSFFSDLS